MAWVEVKLYITTVEVVIFKDNLVLTQGSHDNTCATFNCTFLLRAWATKILLAC